MVRNRARLSNFSVGGAKAGIIGLAVFKLMGCSKALYMDKMPPTKKELSQFCESSFLSAFDYSTALTASNSERISLLGAFVNFETAKITAAETRNAGRSS